MLLASGTAVPISQLKPGDKVLATSTKTGKTQAESVTAVLVRHDTDLYDLKIRDRGKTSVIDTTSNHLFWVPSTGGHSGRWVKAGSLKYGTQLRTPGGGDAATVIGGWVPRQRDGWMWDLTVPATTTTTSTSTQSSHLSSSTTAQHSTTLLHQVGNLIQQMRMAI